MLLKLRKKSEFMLNIGQINRLLVSDAFPFGFYLKHSLEDSPEDAVLLPLEDAPDPCEIGMALDVFVYHDSDDRLVATLNTPNAMLNDVAFMRVKHVTGVGAFLDWGLKKDLLVPHSEQAKPLQERLGYVVFVYQDEETDRLAASTKLHRFLDETNEQHFRAKQPVKLLIYGKTELGYKAIIDGSHLGLIFKDEVIFPLRVGDTVDGFIKRIRSDDKIDLCFQFHDDNARASLADQILDDLEAHGGISTLTDKSPANEISQRFGVSKGAYKKALGALYKQKRIVLEKDKITLISK
ncbi:S1-like domain-containing RNA-binding protein [Aestuariibacter sp. AA17]|uniref:S1-like domain-containing RNA-binding protein n=1 Tax=Fluctibacter corallii TaxID=2984329 RepID=A0ABT3A6L4_9ALTE|nr:S1-like domain-containing RNA-binding protein [Aestuariibacter sp. AA17]MCV2883927.1 S1-like domain-containing RNA-binding protein [Aestuariibacter sp. AA17]